MARRQRSMTIGRTKVSSITIRNNNTGRNISSPLNLGAVGGYAACGDGAYTELRRRRWRIINRNRDRLACSGEIAGNIGGFDRVAVCYSSSNSIIG